MVFSTAVMSRMEVDRWEGVGGKPKAGYTIHKDTHSSSVGHRNSHSQPGGPDGIWQKFDTPCSLISAPQWLHRPCSVLSWFYRVGCKSRPGGVSESSCHAKL